MNHEPHPIATAALKALHRDPAGRLQLAPRGLDTVRRELEQLQAEHELRAAVLSLVELAYLLEHRQGAAAAAASLRALASEQKAPLASGQARGKTEAEARARGAVARFSRFSGARPEVPPAPAGPGPAGAPRGIALRDLRPPPRRIAAR